MFDLFKIATLSLFCFTSVATASEQGNIEGFGIASWGMLKNEIVATEGTPTYNDKDTGAITYNDKLVMGKKTIVKYMFEKGCTDFDISQCRFSDGTYIFNNVSKDFISQIKGNLKTKYGLPDEAKTTTKACPSIALTGKCEIETETSELIIGKSSISYISECSLYDFHSKITDKDVKAGACRITLSYFGPYYFQTEVNRLKLQDRGL